RAGRTAQQRTARADEGDRGARSAGAEPGAGGGIGGRGPGKGTGPESGGQRRADGGDTSEQGPPERGEADAG
ncbi:polyketide synthase, partial [Mycobacterium tuberculosis]